MKTNDDISVRVVLFEKAGNELTFKKTDAVQQYWKEGKHPKECNGACKLVCYFIVSRCDSCGWMEDY